MSFGARTTLQVYHVEKGDVDGAWAEADFIVEGEYRTGAQEQLYIENQGMIALANPPDGVDGLGLAAVSLLRAQGAGARFSACPRKKFA